MTCPFCGLNDDNYDIRYHYERHNVEAQRRIAKALEGILSELEWIRAHGIGINK